MLPKPTLAWLCRVRFNSFVMLTLVACAAGGTDARAQESPPLSFVVPAVHGPGTPGFGLVSDPTIQPYLGPGVPAPVGLTLPVDLQGNGRPDVLACHASFPPDPRTKAPCRLLRPQSDGSLVDITRTLLGAGALPSVEHPREIVVADFNRDQRPDIFVAAHGYDTHPFDGETNVLLISNLDGTYSDRSSTLPQVPDFSHSACAGDVNDDGRIDIYVGNLGPREVGPYFLIGNGDGTFTRTQTGLPTQIANSTESFLSCALVQVDGDGFVDLVLGTWSVGGFTASVVLYGDGRGDFTGRARYVLPATTQGVVTDIAPFDVNRDGRPDLFIVTQASNSATGGFGLQILMNQGNGTYRDETTARLPTFTPRSTGPFCAFVRFADFNGDGWEDFFCDTNGWNENEPRVWLNSANGTWVPVPPGSMPQQSTFAIMHAVDFEGDGRSDLLRVGFGPPSPDIGYRSWLNRTARSVPSEPLMRTSSAGDSQATISFSAPLSSGGSSVTGYTATCRPATFDSSVTRSGAASPLTVTGLTNGRRYECFVTATNAAGKSLPSATATVLPAVANLGPGYTGAWYNAAQDGHGIFVEILPNNVMVAAWYVYSPDGQQSWIVGSGNISGNTAAVDGTLASGGRFLPNFNPAQIVRTPWGRMNFTFTDCNSGRLDYTSSVAGYGSGTIPLARLTLPAGSACTPAPQ